jgi:hypothetical protein
LITRSRANTRYPFFGLPRFIATPVVRLVHFVMQRKQLLGTPIARRSSTRSSTGSCSNTTSSSGTACESTRRQTSCSLAAQHVDLQRSLLVRLIIALRALAMGDAARSQSSARTDRRNSVKPGVVALRWILLRLLKREVKGNQLQSLAHGRTH